MRARCAALAERGGRGGRGRRAGGVQWQTQRACLCARALLAPPVRHRPPMHCHCRRPCAILNDPGDPLVAIALHPWRQWQFWHWRFYLPCALTHACTALAALLWALVWYTNVQCAGSPHLSARRAGLASRVDLGSRAAGLTFLLVCCKSCWALWCAFGCAILVAWLAGSARLTFSGAILSRAFGQG